MRNSHLDEWVLLFRSADHANRDAEILRSGIDGVQSCTWYSRQSPVELVSEPLYSLRRVCRDKEAS